MCDREAVGAVNRFRQNHCIEQQTHQAEKAFADKNN